jgi:threonine dehydrogenase-like Zn-dependent dehydrogenase
MGIDGVFNPENGDLIEWAKEMTNGEYFDIAIECVGSTQVYQNCIDVCTIRGTVGILGVTKEKVCYDYSIISMKELHMVGARNGMREDFEDIIDLISTDTLGTDIRPMISGIYDFTEAKNVMERIREDGEHVMKMMLKFDI